MFISILFITPTGGDCLFVMWHEARRQERMVKGMIVDYRKRAERRRNFYEKTKQDPTQFLQVRKPHVQAVKLLADFTLCQFANNRPCESYDHREYMTTGSCRPD